MEPLFTMHPGVATHLVPALFELYKDVEYTDRGNQFYEKFSMRSQISELLEWLWTIPAHLDTWRKIGAPALIAWDWWGLEGCCHHLSSNMSVGGRCNGGTTVRQHATIAL